MSKKFAIVVFGLLVLYASQGWAGTAENGWAQAEAKTRYAFCYAGNVKVVYLSQVMTIARGVSTPNLANVYANYIQSTYGVSVGGMMRCIAANSNADAAAEKERYKGLFGTARLIEIEWAGGSAVVH